MKKILSLALVLMLCLTASSALAEKLTVWCWDPAFNLYAMQEAEKVYQQDHPDFELEIIETPWNDLQTKLTTAGMAGDVSTLPDIFLCQDNAFQKNVLTFPEIFADLTGSSIAFDNFGVAKTAYSVVDGKNYGVPFDNGAVVGAYRTDVLEQAGYTLADLTDIGWDRFIEIGKDVLAKTGKALLSDVGGEPDTIMILLQSCGSSLFNEDGSPNIVGNDKLVAMMETYATLIKEGVLINTSSWDEYIGSFINGNVAGTINGCWILASIQTAADQSGKWGLTNIPMLAVEGATNYSNNGGSSWAISANANKELAIDFLSKTFAGSVPLYETILPSSGALATYLPAGQSDVYAQPSEFFAGQPIFADITEFAGKIPSNITGVYYYEGRDAVAAALSNYLGGMDLQAALEEAEANLSFQMGL